MSDALVIIPTYNERENIDAMLRRVLGLGVAIDVLVVDDSSPDSTAKIVRQWMADAPGRVHLIERQGKLGLGSAYVRGFHWALEHGYHYIMEMDADFSHNPDDLPRLLEACKVHGYDLAIGSRYVTGVNVVNWPMSRVLLSYFASKYVRMITRMPVQDTTAGFKCFRAEVLRVILAERIRFTGYAFQIEMKFKAWKYGFKLKEVPIIFTERAAGQSKMTPGIVREAVIGVIRMKIRSWLRSWKRPQLPPPPAPNFAEAAPSPQEQPSPEASSEFSQA